MKTVVVSAGQSLVDVCLQELGTVAALFDLADANGLAITDPLQPGQQLTVPASLLSAPAVVAYYAGQQLRVNVPDPLRSAAPAPPVPPTPPHDFLASDFLRTDVY
jgi:LysM repeat protein